MRGIYTAAVLHRLSAHFQVSAAPDGSKFDVGRRFDVIAGTSTGGILACGLAYGKTTSQLISLYEDVGPKVFKKPVPKGKKASIWWTFRNRNHAANKPDELRRKLRSIFGKETLSDLYRKHSVAVCLPASRMLDGTPKVFKTPHLSDYTVDGVIQIVDACLATSAAPIFLPVAEITESDDTTHKSRYVDGGLWANNPTLIALIEALKICGRSDAQLKRPIQILSIGTSGGVAGETPGRPADLGTGAWQVGVGVANMSLELQGHAYHHMTGLIIDHLRLSGQDVCYARIPNPSINEDQARTLGLDRAGKDAVSLLKSLGDQSAQHVLSLCRRNEEPLAKLVNDIFDHQPNASTP